MKMKVLVTGSSGAVGSKIAETVSKHGTCVGVDLVSGKFTTHLANITDKGVMKK
jgi:nucleoside-diphosphate-sugar epimerase